MHVVYRQGRKEKYVNLSEMYVVTVQVSEIM